jgi:HEAT repeat protein
MKKLIFIIIITLVILPGAKARADSIDVLIKHLHSHNQQTQLAAVSELGRIRNNEAIDALLDFVYERAEDWQVKIKAIRLLGEIPDKGISDKLVTIFNNPFLNEECPAIKWNTAQALGKRFNKGTRAVDSLIEALKYNNLLVREAVVQSLGNIGDSTAVAFLIPLLNDRSFAIRMSTIKALENIGSPETIPALRKIADKEKDTYIKEAALSAIKNIRPD